MKRLVLDKYRVYGHLYISCTHSKSAEAWRAFLKRPENFSGPKAFRGSFRVIFSGPGKCFSKPPETARIPSERFGIFLGLAHGRHRAVIRGKERGLTKRLEIDFGNVF